MQKKKVIVTGISSALLQNIAKQIDFDTYDVIGISRTIDAIENLPIKIVKADLTNLKEIESTFSNCHLIIHGAAITHARKLNKYLGVNFEATKKLVDVANKYNVSQFAFISSYTAGINNGGYAKSKFLAEQYIKENISNYCILRISEVFGGDKEEGIEKLINDVKTKSYVFCPSQIPTKLHPIHLDDASKTIWQRIFKEDYPSDKIINGNKAYDFYEIAKMAKQKFNSKASLIRIGKLPMKLLKFISLLLPFNIGFVPDQIDRLYGKKETSLNNSCSISLKEYISSKSKSV